MTATFLEPSLPRGIFKPRLLGFGFGLKKELKMSDILMEETVWFSASANKWASSDLSFEQADVAICFCEVLSPERSQGWSSA